MRYTAANVAFDRGYTLDDNLAWMAAEGYTFYQCVDHHVDAGKWGWFRTRGVDYVDDPTLQANSRMYCLRRHVGKRRAVQEALADMYRREIGEVAD